MDRSLCASVMYSFSVSYSFSPLFHSLSLYLFLSQPSILFLYSQFAWCERCSYCFFISCSRNAHTFTLAFRICFLCFRSVHGLVRRFFLSFRWLSSFNFNLLSLLLLPFSILFHYFSMATANSPRTIYLHICLP